MNEAVENNTPIKAESNKPIGKEPTTLFPGLDLTRLFYLCSHDYRNYTGIAMAIAAMRGEVDPIAPSLPFPNIVITRTKEKTTFESKPGVANSEGARFSETCIDRKGESRAQLVSNLKIGLNWVREQLNQLHQKPDNQEIKKYYAIAILITDGSLSIIDPEYHPNLNLVETEFDPYQSLAEIYSIPFPEEAPSIPLDHRFFSIYFNLLINARQKILAKTVEDFKRIKINITEENGELILSITNPAELTDEKREDLRTREVLKIGTTSKKQERVKHGYGLAIVDKFVKILGGETSINVEEIEPTEDSPRNTLVNFTVKVPISSLKDPRT